MKLKLVLASAAAVLACATVAHADNFHFTFGSDGDGPGNALGGVITGQILGLTDNAWSAASAVLIDSYTPNVTGLPGTPFLISDYAASLGFVITQNFFLEINGQIVDGVYQINGGYFDLNVQAGGYGYNSMVSPDAQTRVQNLGGLGGVSFSAAPEPATWAMMLVGFGALGAALRSRRTQGLATA